MDVIEQMPTSSWKSSFRLETWSGQEGNYIKTSESNQSLIANENENTMKILIKCLLSATHVPRIVLLCNELKMDWVHFHRHCISMNEFGNVLGIRGMGDRWHTSARLWRLPCDIWSELEFVEEITASSRDKSPGGIGMPEISRIPVAH
jgi:hypothetical protein